MAAVISADVDTLDASDGYPLGRTRARLAFAMTFALMLSDYLSRQVIGAVFPLLKAEWGLSDSQLGSLVSVVALTVAVMSFPLALLSDRIGRVKGITIMAIVWGLATIACGLAESFIALFIARAVIGLGEAGYGGAGAAILTRLYPARSHASVLGTFISAAMFGSVLGVVLGGVLAKSLGWQWAFFIIGAIGVALALVFPLVVKEPKAPIAENPVQAPFMQVLRGVFAQRATTLTLVAAGLGAFMQGALISWAPSYLNRFYGLDTSKAALGAAVVVLCCGVGMVVAGNLADRLGDGARANRLWISMAYCGICACLLLAGFSLPPGMAQIVLVCMGSFLSGAFMGPSAAMVAELVPKGIHASALSLYTLFVALLGLAPAPFVTGVLADHYGLATAMQIVPCMSLVAAVVYFFGARSLAPAVAQNSTEHQREPT